MHYPTFEVDLSPSGSFTMEGLRREHGLMVDYASEALELAGLSPAQDPAILGALRVADRIHLTPISEVQRLRGSIRSRGADLAVRLRAEDLFDYQREFLTAQAKALAILLLALADYVEPQSHRAQALLAEVRKHVEEGEVLGSFQSAWPSNTD